MPTDKNWTVYILSCADSTLYTGCTNDLEQRLRKHQLGQGAKYTRGRLPIKLVYQEKSFTQSQALKRECQIKKLTRQKKINLIKNNSSS